MEAASQRAMNVGEPPENAAPLENAALGNVASEEREEETLEDDASIHEEPDSETK